MNWFEKVFGFKESQMNIDKYISIKDNKLLNSVNNNEFIYGKLVTPTLKELKNKLNNTKNNINGNIKLSQISSDVVKLHDINQNNLFQVASQFNLLEMISPNVTRHSGITNYINDLTQGPVCAMKCPYGTLFRNYFTNINTLDKVDKLFDREFFIMRNGYALFHEHELDKLNKQIDVFEEDIKDNIMFGIQYDTEVNNEDNTKEKHLVSQIYCSAIPVSYHHFDSKKLERISKVILESAYEATFITALLNKKSNKVFITLLGGGAFGNDEEWIMEAIEKNIIKYKDFNLEIVLVQYKPFIHKKFKKLENKYNLN